MFIIIFFLFIALATTYASVIPQNQGLTLLHFRIRKTYHGVVKDTQSFVSRNFNNLVSQHGKPKHDENNHIINNGLPGQPDRVNFNQFAGEITVNESSGRALFYYFVESSNVSSTKPLILWLNGGPGCSSLGMGALSEVGPFGVNPDGKTLYSRQYAWNKEANMLFLESPAGVGFSYSNTTNETTLLSGDRMTTQDTYIFLLKWFQRYPKFKGRDLYLVGESYAGHYIPELADLIFENTKFTNSSTPMINIKGIMIGNGWIDDESDTNGLIDFAWHHALVSNEAREDFKQNCHGTIYETSNCSKVIVNSILEMGNLNFLNIYAPVCQPLGVHPATGQSDPCDLLYVQNYLNLPSVQEALNANRSKLPYPWEPCSQQMHGGWNDSPSSMFPIYKRLIARGLHIVLYSGDVDSCVPVTGTRYALNRMGLKVVEPWKWWSIDDTEVAGYKVVYDGLTYITIKGGGHEVSQLHPDRLFAMLKDLLYK